MSRKKSKYDIASDDKTEESAKQNVSNKDEVSKKAKQLNMVIGIFSVICALAIWLYASAISETEIKLQSYVNVTHTIDVESKGYSIEYNDKLKVNFTVTGKVLSVSQISDKGIRVSADLSAINLSEVTTNKTVQLPLVFDLPEGVVCSEKSQEYIEITIIKK